MLRLFKMKLKGKRSITVILLIMFAIIFGMVNSVSCERNNNPMDKLIAYPDYPEAIQRDYRYSVSVTQGNVTKKLNVYNHTQTGITGIRDYGPDNYRRFCEFAFSGSPVRVDITVHEDVSSYKIIPASYNLMSEMNGNVISVYLDEPKYFMLKINDELNSLLAVFADEPEDESQIPNKNAPDVMYFDAGWHETANGFLEVGTNIKTLYIAPGAVLNARVDIKGSGTLVCGRGIILDPFGDISRYDITVGGNEGSGTKLLTLSAANITVKDIKLLDARCYNIMVNKQNATITNVKILSTMITTDGITFGSASSYTKVKNCFIHNGDNVFVISGFSSSSICTGIEIDDCIVGTTCAAIFPQGTLGSNIIRNLEVFRTSGGLIGNRYNSSSQSRSIAGLTIENLNALECEYFPWIFKGDKMGDAPKLFTLKNISVPRSSGVDNIFSTPTNEDIIIVSGGGYQLNFENLYVDGEPIDNANLLNITNNGLSNNVFNFALNEETAGNIITSPVSYEVNYIEPLKVIIGSSVQFLRTKPVMIDTVIYLPLQEVAEIFKYVVVNTNGQTVSLYKGNNAITATVGSNVANIN